MANDKLTEQSIEFAVHIINLVSGSMFYEGTVAEIKITKTNSET